MTAAVGGQRELRISAVPFENQFTLQGFSHALVQQAWIYHRGSEQSHHVLSQIDLLPDEVPHVDVPEHGHVRLGNESPWTLYFLGVRRHSDEVVRWYDQLVREGAWGPLPSWRTEEKPLTAPQPLQDVLDEPRWPSVVSRDDSTAVPFASSREAGVRMHHLLCQQPRLGDLLEGKELAKLFEAVKNALNFDPSVVPELLQSAHFFQPLPFIRFVNSRLDAPKGADDRSVLINVVPRLGADIAKLEIDVLEHRATGWRQLTRIRPSGPFHRVPLNENVASVAIRVFHDDFGLLYEEGPFAFMRGFSLQMKLQSHERRVEIPARKNEAAKTFRIPVSSSEPMKIVQGKDTRSAATVLHEAAARRRAARGSEETETWFDDDRESASAAVRKILASAEKTAWVVDPYFSAAEVKRWLPFVAESEAQVRVLTSSAGLRQLKLMGLEKAELELEQLKRLEKELETARENRWINATEVRVMLGNQNSPVHDRFLLADGRAWLLGSSLNAFGSRGTMLVQLRRPAIVSTELQNVWEAAKGVDVRIDKLQSEVGGETS